MIGESHTQFAIEMRIKLTVERAVGRTVFLSKVLVLLLQMFSPIMEHHRKFFIQNFSTNGNLYLYFLHLQYWTSVIVTNYLKTATAVYPMIT